MNFSFRTSFILANLPVLALASLAASLPASAQSEPGTPPPVEANVFYEKVGPGPVITAGGFGFVGFEGGMGGKTVTGAPFSANVSTQTTQTLADGNTIQHSTTGTIARDSQGRTRREMSLPAIGPFAATGETPPHAVEIYDAVAGVHYILEPSEKIAHKMEKRGHGARLNIAGAAGAMGFSTEDQTNVTSTSLGTQTINGVTAEGTRDTRTIPAGEIGNAKPITIVSERWYSPDLQMVVLSKRTDPMSGDSITQLTDIQRQEPDPSLFQVPSDFTVKEGGPAVMIQKFKGQVPLPPPPADAGPDTAPAAPQN